MKYVIVGGTGTLGSMLIARLATEGNEVVCISRDELKQQQLRRRYPQVRYMLGDIRDKSSLAPAFESADVVFHVAALKHVDVLEENPTEAIKTNVQGTINVAEAAIEAGVPHVVFSSTDKAVLPINTYGMTKAISEKYLLGLNAKQKTTKYSVFRWGNVVGSRGSVVHLFAESLRADGVVRITDMRMTRFWIHIEDAVEYMLSTYASAQTDSVMIPPMKAAAVVDLAEACSWALGYNKTNIHHIGMRPGEKIHECLESNHDYCLRSDTSERYTRDELVEMVRRVLQCG